MIGRCFIFSDFRGESALVLKAILDDGAMSIFDHAQPQE